MFFKELTEAVIGSKSPHMDKKIETRRTEALQSLRHETSLHQILPRICTFIHEGIRTSLAEHTLPVTIYLLRMIKCLHENPNLDLEKHLAELLPSLISCVITSKITNDVGNDCNLRKFSAQLLADITKTFTNGVNTLQTKVVGILETGLSDQNSSLGSKYGVVCCLLNFPPDVIEEVLLYPKRIKQLWEDSVEILGTGNSGSDDVKAAGLLKDLLTVEESIYFDERRSLIECFVHKKASLERKTGGIFPSNFNDYFGDGLGTLYFNILKNF